MESEYGSDSEGSRVRHEAVNGALAIMSTRARRQSPTHQGTGDSTQEIAPARTFKRYMEASLAYRELPVLGILFSAVAADFNYANSVKTLVTLVFGGVGPSYLLDEALADTMRELEAVLGVLIESRSLSRRRIP